MSPLGSDLVFTIWPSQAPHFPLDPHVIVPSEQVTEVPSEERTLPHNCVVPGLEQEHPWTGVAQADGPVGAGAFVPLVSSLGFPLPLHATKTATHVTSIATKIAKWTRARLSPTFITMPSPSAPLDTRDQRRRAATHVPLVARGAPLRHTRQKAGVAPPPLAPGGATV
jgi:hypothetical protein